MVRAYRKSVKTSAAERSSYDVTSGIIEFESGHTQVVQRTCQEWLGMELTGKLRQNGS